MQTLYPTTWLTITSPRYTNEKEMSMHGNRTMEEFSQLKPLSFCYWTTTNKFMETSVREAIQPKLCLQQSFLFKLKRTSLLSSVDIPEDLNFLHCNINTEDHEHLFFQCHSSDGSNKRLWLDAACINKMLTELYLLSFKFLDIHTLTSRSNPLVIWMVIAISDLTHVEKGEFTTSTSTSVTRVKTNHPQPQLFFCYVRQLL